MLGRPHLDIFHQQNFLLNGCSVGLNFIPADAKFALIRAAGVANGHRIKIHDMSLFIRKITLSPSVYLAHERALQKTAAKYAIRRAILRTFAIPQHEQNVSKDNLLVGIIPRRIIIGFVKTTAFNCDPNENPFNFQHFDLDFLSLYKNGVCIPATPLKPNWAGGSYVRSYMTLFQGTHTGFSNNGCGISYEDYSKGLTLFVFDLTNGQCEGNNFEPVTRGNIRLEGRFRNAIAHSITGVYYAEFDNVLEVDRERQVKIDFTS